MTSRRTFGSLMLGMFAELAIGCASTPPPEVPKLPPLALGKLTDLCTSAGLAWIVLVKPRDIAQIPWLIPDLGIFASEKNLDTFAGDTGLDLRQIPEAVLARFDDSLGGADLQLVRHHGDPKLPQQLFAKRLTKEPVVAAERPDLVRISGTIGTKQHAFARLGDEIVAFQEGGSIEKGPLRIAALYAEEKIKKTPRALEMEPLKSLAARFGNAPVIGLAKGPFDDEWKMAAGGLLEAATAVGGAARPTAREHLGLALAIASDFNTSGDAASETLMAAWQDFAETQMGRLLGLADPIEGPLPTHTSDVVALSLEVDAHRFAEGLHALVSEDVDAIMKL